MSQSSTASRARLLDAAMVLLFAVLAGLLLWRSFHSSASGVEGRGYAYQDFDATVYYPVRAVVDGVNPYVSHDRDAGDYMNQYPVHAHFPLYSPLLLLFGAPFALPPPKLAAFCWSVFNLGLLLGIAWSVIKLLGRPPRLAYVFGLAALLLLLQPTRAAWQLGQATLALSLATYVIVHYGDRRRWLTTLALAVASIKPNLAGPTGVLLASRGDWRSTVSGMLVAGICTVVGMGLIFARAGDASLESVLGIVAGNQAHFNEHPDVDPATTIGRVDVAATLEYLTGRSLPSFASIGLTIAVLIAAAVVLWRNRSPDVVEHAASVRSTLLLLSATICIYHKYYDLAILVLPIGASLLAAHPSWRGVSKMHRWLIALLMSLPFVNPLVLAAGQAGLESVSVAWTESPEWGRQVVRIASGLNGLALAAAWLLCWRAVAVGRAAQSNVNIVECDTTNYQPC